MTEKRFTLSKDTEWWFVEDNTIKVNEYGYRDDLTGEDKYRGLKQDLTEQEVVDLLNELAEENQQLKSILQDMGLIMSNEEVRNVRDEIASKLIKPLCKGNGFDVDVDTENGFTIIPKEVNNDRE